MEKAMNRPPRPAWLIVVATALLAAATACSHEATTTGPGGSSAAARLTVRLASVASSSSLSGAPTTLGGILASDFGGPGGFDGPGGDGDFADGMGHHWHGWWGWMRAHNVDSLIVTATKLEVLSARPDTEDAADSATEAARADSGEHHGDDDDDWEEREFGWTDLAVVGDGHLDLMHLPDSAAGGLPIATDSLPAGTYRHVRLFITNPMIYFDSLIVTPAGDTLQPGVGYPVIFPSADSTGAAIKTDDPFTVPAVGDTVQMVFDRDDTVRHIIITGDGKIIVPPVMRFRHWH
jgi:hypothetical protein